MHGQVENFLHSNEIAQEKIKNFIERFMHQAEEVAIEEEEVLRAMKKACLPDDLLRRVFYDNCSSVENVAKDLKHLFISVSINERKEEIDKSLNNILANMPYISLWETKGYTIEDRKQNIYYKIIAETKKGIPEKNFTSFLYAQIRPKLNKIIYNIKAV